MIDLPDPKIGCHHTGFTKKCRKLVVDGICNRWVQIAGMNPNTGEQVNKCDCVDNWGPFLQIENSQMQRQTGAAVESFRNEMVVANAQARTLLSDIVWDVQSPPQINLPTNLPTLQLTEK